MKRRVETVLGISGLVLLFCGVPAVFGGLACLGALWLMDRRAA